MIIPPGQLDDDTLRNLVEEFITREGTDYGESEVPLETKVVQVLSQLNSGKVLIVFDEASETCNLVNSEDLPPDDSV